MLFQVSGSLIFRPFCGPDYFNIPILQILISVNKTNYFLGGLFIVTSIAGILTPLYLPQQLYQDISCVKTFCVVSTFAVGLAMILFTRKKPVYLMNVTLNQTERIYYLNDKFGNIYSSWLVHMFANFAINTIGCILFGIL